MAETRYARIIDETTHEVQVGVGCDEAYYIEIGMTVMDVELAYDNKWYVAGFAPIKPAPTPEEEKKARIAELKGELSSTDYKIIKCSECSLAGAEMPYDVVALHAQRQAIRDEINKLEG
jgi:hypothetical protein